MSKTHTVKVLQEEFEFVLDLLIFHINFSQFNHFF